MRQNYDGRHKRYRVLGGTPLAVAINDEIVGLVSLKDTLKKDIREKLEEVHVVSIDTVMITGDNLLTVQGHRKRGKY